MSSGNSRDCHAPNKRQLSAWELFVFSIVIGTLQVLIFRYRYGVDLQVETITALLRQMDPSYLSRDFFVNSTDLVLLASAYAL
ncbi:MAG: hypothetical protein K1Y02_20370 [Candidatus Hydrogenedentes bacterium]|nr:hypothetical protein [Candidatus Hydrogenedentota bacterium]